ncbi:transposase [Streptomyces sp. NBC_01012]|nr:transposase [Streptomyces sp. NBC_01012]
MVSSVAGQLGISSESLRGWVKKAEAGPAAMSFAGLAGLPFTK